MPIGIAFWVIMLIWLVFGLFGHAFVAAGVAATVSTVLLFVLFFLLGWKVFGFMLQG
jgi:hypothetical protein